jgi:RND family efflux transporter MFP subunit
MTNPSRRNKRLFFIVAVVALLAAGGAWYYYGQVLPTEASASSSAETVKTARVRRGNLIVSASGTGVLVPVTEVDLGFRTGGVLAEVPVEVGDRVEAGDLLAWLDTAELERAVTQGEIALRQAQIRLETVQEPADEDDIQRAQDAIDQAAAALHLAQINLVAAQDDVAANEVLEDAQSAYEEALHDYNYWLDEYNENDVDYWFVDDAKQKLDDAKLALSRAQQRADQILQSARNDLARTTDLYDQAQNDLDALLAAPDERDIESLQLDVQTAQLNLAAAQENLANASLTASFDGVVAAVQAQPSEMVGTAPIVTLADLDNPLVELYLDETDLDKVEPGYEVTVIFDAMSEDTFTGRVVRVEPGLVLIEGVPTIQALAALEGEGLGNPRFLPAGLNASVEVIGGKAENALLVPVEALKELSPGNYSVFVVVGGQLEPRVVQVGLMDLSYAEIISGLEQGEIVSTGAVETE